MCRPVGNEAGEIPGELLDTVGLWSFSSAKRQNDPASSRNRRSTWPTSLSLLRHQPHAWGRTREKAGYVNRVRGRTREFVVGRSQALTAGSVGRAARQQTPRRTDSSSARRGVAASPPTRRAVGHRSQESSHGSPAGRRPSIAVSRGRDSRAFQRRRRRSSGCPTARSPPECASRETWRLACTRAPE